MTETRKCTCAGAVDIPELAERESFIREAKPTTLAGNSLEFRVAAKIAISAGTYPDVGFSKR